MVKNDVAASNYGNVLADTTFSTTIVELRSRRENVDESSADDQEDLVMLFLLDDQRLNMYQENMYSHTKSYQVKPNEHSFQNWIYSDVLKDINLG